MGGATYSALILWKLGVLGKYSLLQKKDLLIQIGFIGYVRVG